MLKRELFHYFVYTIFLSLNNVFMIKKLTQAMLALALVGGMSACTQRGGNDTPEPNSSTGNTYMSVAISTTQPSNMLKAEEDKRHNEEGEYIGRDKIEDLSVYVISLPEGKVEKQEFANADLAVNPDNNAKTQDYRTTAWKVDAGKKEVYVLANINGTDIKTDLDAATSKSAFETAYAKAYTMTDANGVLAAYAKFDNTNDIIAMNGKTEAPMEVVGGIKKEQAEAGTANCAKINLRRLVAQTVVTRSDVEDNLTIKATRDGKEITLATLSDLKWDVMQFEKTTYLAPMPTEDGKDATRVDYCMTPSFSFIPSATVAYAGASDKYYYRKMTGETVTTFTRGAKGSNVDNIVRKPMKFVTETTHQYGNKLKDDGGVDPFTGYRKGNTPYVIVSAKITPSTEAWATGEEAADGDLYLGLNDGKFYSSKEKAKEANGNDDKNVLTYKGATCYYVAWLNPNNPSDPVTSPVLRNNIYHVNIKGFKNIGYTGNPFNPGNDDPKDPNDKTPDPKETLYPVDTYMAVEIIVINWGVHSYDIEL